MDRLLVLQRLAVQKPDDPFPQYGLAMELRKLARHAEAKAAFEDLLSRHPDYVPSYLMFGQLLIEMGESLRARDVFERGYRVATDASDAHAASELAAARAELDQ